METSPVMTWAEAKAMCLGVSDVFEKSAVKDADRMIKIRDGFHAVCSKYEEKQASSRQAVQAALNEIERIERHEADRDNSAEMNKRLEELGAIKLQLSEQLEQLKENQITIENHINELITEYEQAQRRYLEECATREKDVPRLRQNMSVYASITGIKWDFTSDHIAGCIHIPDRKLLSSFDLNPSDSSFEIANALWDIIDKAHGSLPALQ